MTGPTRSFYQNSTPLGKFAPRLGFAWQPFGAAGRAAVRGGYGWFYQAPAYSANAGKRSPVHRGAVCAGIHQYRRQQWPVGSPEAVSDDHAGLCGAHAHLPAF